MFKKNKKPTENVKEKKVRTVKVGTHKKTVIALWVVLIASVSFGVYKNFTAIDQHTTHTSEISIQNFKELAPTLEDVFLSMIEESEGKSNEVKD